MTALKPIANRRVRGVAAEKYPLNKLCAHPECTEPAVDPHHVFPRSLTKSASYFVQINDSQKGEIWSGPIIPHVAGLCRAHHDDVEEHRAWVKLEDGEFRWYTLVQQAVGIDIRTYALLGPLNPQPGSQEGRPKRRKFSGAARRARKTISVKVPLDEKENGAGLLDEAITTLEDKLGHDPHRPVYYTLMDSLNYTILNAGPEDFDE